MQEEHHAGEARPAQAHQPPPPAEEPAAPASSGNLLSGTVPKEETEEAGQIIPDRHELNSDTERDSLLRYMHKDIK